VHVLEADIVKRNSIWLFMLAKKSGISHVTVKSNGDEPVRVNGTLTLDITFSARTVSLCGIVNPRIITRSPESVLTMGKRRRTRHRGNPQRRSKNFFFASLLPLPPALDDGPRPQCKPQRRFRDPRTPFITSDFLLTSLLVF
jgi:hypothetical protein